MKLRIFDIDFNSMNSKLSMTVDDGVKQKELWFELPRGASKPHPDLIANAIAAIFGNSFDEIEYLHPVSEEAHSRLENATQATWNTPIHRQKSLELGDKVVLNFSGGFDSLAALALLGPNSVLVSIDFGSRFERERRFFETFDTNIISTNAREFERSWTFMGVGAILMSEQLGANSVSFGNILEASPWHFVKRSGAIAPHPAFGICGLGLVSPLIGMTEFGTALVAASEYPGKIIESLNSLADPHTEKYLRKSLLLKLVAERNTLKLGELQPSTFKNKLSWGNSFAADFLAPGILKFVGGDKSQQWMDFPNGLEKTTQSLNLDFYWRECPDIYTEFPRHLVSYSAEKKAEFGIRPYGVDDWRDFHKVLDFLRLHHPFPAPTF